jgi:hypothetical protein
MGYLRAPARGVVASRMDSRNTQHAAAGAALQATVRDIGAV